MSMNILPVHNNLKSLSSGFILDSLVSDYDVSNKAYSSLLSLDSGFTLDDMQSSGYQYVVSGNASPIFSELASILDQTSLTVNINITETLSLRDTAVADDGVSREQVGLLDQTSLIVHLQFEELLGASDSGSSAEEVIDAIFGLKVECLEYLSTTSGIKTECYEYLDSTYGVHVANGVYDLVATTDASSVDNVYAPTVSCGGILYYYNPATYPAGGIPAGVSTYIGLAPTGFSGIDDVCQIYNYNFDLGYTGGSFNIISQNAPGYNGEEVTIFGIKGIINKLGPIVSNSTFGYKTDGIFGTSRLNQQLSYLLYGLPSYNNLIPSQTLRIPRSDYWRTASDAARAIASLAGVTVQWLANDAPLSNFFPEAGSSVLDSLSSLAQRVGATLRWNGGDGFIVNYPDRPMGYWEVPDCCLITSSGIAYQNILDISQGNPVGIYVVPNLNLLNTASATQGNNNASNSPAVNQIAKVTKLLTSSDPALVYDLPPNYDKVYIQILIPSGQSTGGSNQGLSLNNFVTADPDTWFEFDVESLNNDYIFLTNIGGVYVPQVKVDYRVFPNNNSVQAGNFVLSLACTLKSKQTQYDDAAQQRRDRMGELLAGQQDAYRFTKIYDGVINCQFFGSIPLPGMWAKATVSCPSPLGTTTVEGIVENVSFTFPGVLSIQVAQYARLTFIQQKLNIRNP